MFAPLFSRREIVQWDDRLVYWCWIGNQAEADIEYSALKPL
jgi:hypothetical protein